MNFTVLKAVFKRDFISYFSSPTGYVFICVFAVLSGLATFWSPQFFTLGLANLDQLSSWLPFIMLVFIPAITMSIWAEERRQGTDELLLTIPASDLDIVLGKYLAGVAIFTVSLLFSAFSIFVVFKYGLGDPDAGLYLSTFIGYWFIGIAMIAVGMVASFLTDNLTVGFILGTLFNLPLALFGVAGWIFKDSPTVAQTLRRWSAVEQFRDFERGTLSLGGMVYFLGIAAVMVYLSMVLISRRHWRAREDGPGLGWHYFLRTLCLIAIACGITVLIQENNWLRADMTSAKLNSLSADTVSYVEKLRNDDQVNPITIDAYISSDVPNDFATARANLLTTLEELQALGGDKITVNLHDIPIYGDEADTAETVHGITPQEHMSPEGGKAQEFFLGLAFSSGLDKVVVPFINTGIPVEYELIRSILTVASPERKKLGIVNTNLPFIDVENPDVSTYGVIVRELQKQYDVDPVDPSEAIPDNYDVLLAIQPSMLGPDEMDHFVDAVRAGIPTAIFEDPYPHFFTAEQVAGTGEQRRQDMGPMAMFQQGPRTIPKGDINQLWRLLQVRMDPTQVVWQSYEPEFGVIGYQTPQWIFVDDGNAAAKPFSDEDPITAGLNQVLLIYPGSLYEDSASGDGTAELTFEPLVNTGKTNSGLTPTRAIPRDGPNLANEVPLDPTSQGYILAAHITGKPAETTALLDKPLTDENDPADLPDEETAEQKPINAVVVSDIDWTNPAFFDIRARGVENFLTATQNVTLMLNTLDELAGDQRFLAIRKRTRPYRRLTDIDRAQHKYRKIALEKQEDFVKEINDKLKEAEEKRDENLDKLRNTKGLSRTAMMQKAAQLAISEEQNFRAEAAELNAQRKKQKKKIDKEMEDEIDRVQMKYKLLGLSIPLVPPLLLAFAVFFHRREKERQGVSQERLR